MRRILLLVSLAFTARAAPLPVVLTHTGYLLNGSDGPVTNPSLPLEVKLWSSATATDAGSLVWPPLAQPATCAVDVKGGYYTASIGDVCGTGLTTAFVGPADARWLEVIVDGVTLSPRVRLQASSTAVTAQRALTADTLGTLAPGDVWARADDLAAANVGGQALSARLAALAPATGGTGYVQAQAATATAQATGFHVANDAKVDGNFTVGGTVTAAAFAGAGVLGLAQGGLGASASAFGAGALPMMNGGGTAFTPVVPGAAGQILVSTGNAWASTPIIDLSFARRTTAALQIFVNTAGNDACDGLGSGTSGTTGCAVRTLRRAVELIPDVVDHPVTVELAAGTYLSDGSQVIVNKFVRTAGTLLFRGTGSVILSGATTAGGPAVAPRALYFPVTTTNATVQGVTLDKFTSSALYTAKALTMTNVTSRNSALGLHCDTGSSCTFTGTNDFSQNTSDGIYTRGAILSVSGTLTANSNGQNGVEISYGSTFSVGVGASATTSSNTGHGLLVTWGSVVGNSGTLTANANGQIGVAVDNASGLSFGSVTTNNNGSHGLYAAHASTLSGTNVTSQNNGGHALFVAQRSGADLGGTLTLQTVNGTSGLAATMQSGISYGGGAGATIACPVASASTYGVYAEHGSVVLLYSTGAFAISNCAVGFFAHWGSQILDGNNASGARTITGATTPFYANVGSFLQRGHFAGTATCTNTSQCF